MKRIALAAIGALAASFAQAASPLPQAPRPPDPIESLRRELTRSGDAGLWQNGVFPRIDLPADASPEAVITHYFKQTSEPQGKVDAFQLTEARTIRLFDGQYRAVRVYTAYGSRILLMKHSAPAGWWTKSFVVPSAVPRISKDVALRRARRAGVDGTWISVSLKGEAWHLAARSKSARAPAYVVIDGQTGAVIYLTLNSDAERVPVSYLRAPSTEAYDRNEAETIPAWHRRADLPEKR